jgi:hypothetical protein
VTVGVPDDLHRVSLDEYHRLAEAGVLETAPLVIEVAASSQRRDLVVKPRIYAEAGVPRYWVVDLDARGVVVHTEPAGEAYNSVHVVDASGALEAPELGLPPIAVGELLVAAAP